MDIAVETEYSPIIGVFVEQFHSPSFLRADLPTPQGRRPPPSQLCTWYNWLVKSRIFSSFNLFWVIVYVQIIRKQQLKVHLSMTCMNLNNFEQPEQPGLWKPVNAILRWKVLSCHEPRNTPLGLQPFSGVSIHWCCDPNVPAPYTVPTLNRAAALIITEQRPVTRSNDGVILIFQSFVRSTTVGDHRDRPYQALRRQQPSPPLPTVSSTQAVAVGFTMIKLYSISCVLDCFYYFYIQHGTISLGYAY